MGFEISRSERALCLSKYLSVFVSTYAGLCRASRRHARRHLRLRLNSDLCRDLYREPHAALNRALLSKPFQKPFLSSFRSLHDFWNPSLLGLVNPAPYRKTQPTGQSLGRPLHGRIVVPPARGHYI